MFPGTPLDERLHADVMQLVYNETSDEDGARLRATDHAAQDYYAPVERPRIRTVYTQVGFNKAIREDSLREVHLSSSAQGDGRFTISGEQPRPVIAMGHSDVTVDGGRIVVVESATVTAQSATVECRSGYVTMTGGSAKVSGGVVHATAPTRYMDCRGGETHCYGVRYEAFVSGGTFWSHGSGVVTVSDAAAEVFADGGAVRAMAGTVQAQGPAIVYAWGGTIWAHGGARIDATGGYGHGTAHARVVSEGCYVKAGGTTQITARAGTTVVATDNAVVDADNTCTVYTIGDSVTVQNVAAIPVDTMADAGADFGAWH